MEPQEKLDKHNGEKRGICKVEKEFVGEEGKFGRESQLEGKSVTKESGREI